MFTTITYNLHPNAEHQQILKELMYNSARFYNLCLRKRKNLFSRHHDTSRLSDGAPLPTKKGFQSCMNSLPQWLSTSIMRKADKKADEWIYGTAKSPREIKPMKTTSLDITECPKSLESSFLVMDKIGTIVVDKHCNLPNDYKIVRWTVCMDSEDVWFLRLLATVAEIE